MEWTPQERMTAAKQVQVRFGLEFYGASPAEVELQCELNQLRAASPPEAAGRGDGPEFVSRAFIEAMNDIGRYGHQKYGEDSFQHRRLTGDTSRGGMDRTTSLVIMDHAHNHFQMYLGGLKHDHFGTLLHQLAASAFNAMMEAHFAGLLSLPAAPSGEQSQPIEMIDLSPPEEFDFSLDRSDSGRRSEVKDHAGEESSGPQGKASARTDAVDEGEKNVANRSDNTDCIMGDGDGSDRQEVAPGPQEGREP